MKIFLKILLIVFCFLLFSCSSVENEDAYVLGFAAGEEAGEETGYGRGVIAGYEERDSRGYLEGYDEGEDRGFENGLNQGQVSGREEGLLDGYQLGVLEGRRSRAEELLDNPSLEELFYERYFRKVRFYDIKIELPYKGELLLMPGTEFRLFFVNEIENNFIHFEVTSLTENLEIDPVLVLNQVVSRNSMWQMHYCDDGDSGTKDPVFNFAIDPGVYIAIILGYEHRYVGRIGVEIYPIY